MSRAGAHVTRLFINVDCRSPNIQGGWYIKSLTYAYYLNSGFVYCKTEFFYVIYIEQHAIIYVTCLSLLINRSVGCVCECLRACSLACQCKFCISILNTF